MRTLPGDLASMENAVEDWASGHGLDWDPFYAHKEVPAWDEEVSNHSNQEVVSINWSASSVSDAAILHAYDDGSGSLGWWERGLVENSRCLPVLVVAHRNEKVSKSWLGLADLYQNLTITRFDDHVDLYRVVQEWLTAHRNAISAGPKVRQEIDQRWSLASQLLLRAWRGAADDQRRQLAQVIPRAEPAMTWILSSATTLAELPADSLARILSILRIDLAKAETAHAAEGLFDGHEILAWRQWARSQNPDYAWSVFLAAVEERQQMVVAREPDFLGLPGSWREFADRWQRRALR